MVKLGRSTGRAMGRTRDIDSAHRRDGLGFTFLVLAVIFLVLAALGVGAVRKAID